MKRRRDNNVNEILIQLPFKIQMTLEAFCESVCLETGAPGLHPQSVIPKIKLC